MDGLKNGEIWKLYGFVRVELGEKDGILMCFGWTEGMDMEIYSEVMCDRWGHQRRGDEHNESVCEKEDQVQRNRMCMTSMVFFGDYIWVSLLFSEKCHIRYWLNAI